MTWEETIESIRSKSEFKDLVRDAYFDSNLHTNVERFKSGEEFQETLSLLKDQKVFGGVLADIGSGNGIASIAFALGGYKVISVEPDPSNTIGAGSIRKLTAEYNLENRVSVIERYGEDTGLGDGQVDVVYIRQAMHHAHDLGTMIKECYRILKPGGILLTVRDHVIFDEKDKEWFLESHPLHKFYGGENAFTEEEYKGAMIQAGFNILKILKYYDSIINYFPLTKLDIEELVLKDERRVINRLQKKIGRLADIGFVQYLYKKYTKFDPAKAFDESRVPGRMYTFLASKP